MPIINEVKQATKSANSAYTLIELVVSIVIISVAIVGMLLAFNTTARASGNPIVTHQSAAVAEGYIEEILLQAFPKTLPCPPPPPGGRSKYTNICDYNNLIDVGIKNYKGDAIAGLNN
jgi:MSHA pilin protein MshD